MIKNVHAQGHFGANSMKKKLISEGFWWPKMSKQLQEEVDRCHPCLLYNVEREGYQPAKSIIADKPWDHVEIDLVGPLPTSDGGATFILNVVDVCTGYTVLRAINNKEMKTIAEELWKIFTDYGTPKIVQSDNGKEFVNQLVQALHNTFGIEHRLITTYHPNANGLVERKNKDVEQVLRKYLEGVYGTWDKWIPMVQIVVNEAINRRTKRGERDISRWGLTI
jgi:transposase InsO family protein